MTDVIPIPPKKRDKIIDDAFNDVADSKTIRDSFKKVGL